MIVSIKNKQMKDIIEQSKLSEEAIDEVLNNFSMFINHIENGMNKEELQQVIITSLAENFLMKWKRK